MRLGRAELPSHRERPYLVTNDDNPPEQLLLRWRIQADPPATRWTSGGTVLPRNSYLAAGDSLTSGAYRLVMQGDGNLVLYGGAAIWVTDTDNQCPGPEARMQPDGNVVLYCAGVAKQATGTDGHPGAALSLHPDRHLVLTAEGSDFYARSTTSPHTLSGGCINSADRTSGDPAGDRSS